VRYWNENEFNGDERTKNLLRRGRENKKEADDRRVGVEASKVRPKAKGHDKVKGDVKEGQGQNASVVVRGSWRRAWRVASLEREKRSFVTPKILASCGVLKCQTPSGFRLGHNSTLLW
jgi:hypothetical protein